MCNDLGISFPAIHVTGRGYYLTTDLVEGVYVECVLLMAGLQPESD